MISFEKLLVIGLLCTENLACIADAKVDGAPGDHGSPQITRGMRYGLV